MTWIVGNPETYFTRLCDSLRYDFEATHRVLTHALGDIAFQRLVADYLVCHPSKRFSVDEVERSLPSFVQTHAFSRRLEFLPDLVALEWALIEAFHAQEIPPVGLQPLDSSAEEDWPRALIQLHPSVRLIHSRWPVDDIWRDSDVSNSEERFLVVSRDQGTLQVSSVGALQWQILDWVRTRWSLGRICERLAAHPEVTPEMLRDWLGDWIKSGWVSGIMIPLEC